MNATPAHPCPHCGTLVEGPEGTFCCHGCATAAQLLSETGLSSWYDTRQQQAPRSQRAAAIAWDTLPTRPTEDGVECTLQVGGLRCASCVWVTEQVLQRTPGVKEAYVSYATGRTRLTFDPEVVALADLADRIATLGYTPQPAGADQVADRDLMIRTGVATFCAMNVMGLSVGLYAGWLDGMSETFVRLFQQLSLWLATPAVLWCAVPFYKGAWGGLKNRTLHMDLPISLAILVMFAHGLVATFLHLGEPWFDSLTMLVALLLAGRMLEARGRRRTAEAAASLAAVVPATARKVVGDAIEQVPSDQLAEGDVVLVAMGEEVPADGVALTGGARARMSLLTGESRPVTIAAGDELVAGAVIDEGHVELRVTRTGSDTVVQKMAQQLEKACDQREEVSAADRLAPVFTAGTLGLAALTLAGTWAFVDASEAIRRTIAVLVVACPCALALSAPMVRAAGLGAAARRGLLLRSGSALLSLAEVDQVVIDKTGTATEGEPRVVRADDEALRVAAALERTSAHPIARAILSATAERGIPIPTAQQVREIPGEGLRGRLDGHDWTLGAGDGGQVVLRRDDGAWWPIELQDIPRSDTPVAIARLKDEGAAVELLTGDHVDVARAIGDQVGADRVTAQVSPSDKQQILAARQAEGHHVLFVGDGLNDGPALAQADVGLALSSGAVSSVLVSDGVILGGHLSALPTALRIGRLVRRRERLNLWRSGAYNVLAVGAAMAGLVNPLVAAILMPLSSGLVIGSAASLERAVRKAG